jgi:hypothetical protein
MTNLKIALSFISVPFGISFLSGAFDWYFDDGFYILLGASMLIGIIWAWVAVYKMNKV